jgi:hypothetical protein
MPVSLAQQQQAGKQSTCQAVVLGLLHLSIHPPFIIVLALNIDSILGWLTE